MLFIFSLFYSATIFPNVDFQFLNYYKIRIMEGNVIDFKYHTYLRTSGDWYSIFFLLIYRFFYFFAYVDEEFSFLHNTYNLIYYSSIYLLILYSLLKYNFNVYERRILRICFFTVFLVSSFHAVTLIDYDWRYRLPCYLPISIILLFCINKCNIKYLIN